MMVPATAASAGGDSTKTVVEESVEVPAALNTSTESVRLPTGSTPCQNEESAASLNSTATPSRE